MAGGDVDYGSDEEDSRLSSEDGGRELLNESAGIEEGEEGELHEGEEGDGDE